MLNVVEKINKNIYFPLLSSEDINGGNVSSEEYRSVWSKFLSLDESKKNILTSDELPQRIKQLQERFHCDDVAIEGTSILIRWFFFGEINTKELQDGLQDIFESDASDAFEFIQKEILTIQPKVKVEKSEDIVQPKKVTVSMPLLQALSKYENLGNQLISRDRIKVKSQQEPVRPSLLYWIKYYRDELGVGQHSSIDRGNFLFRSENGAKLSPEERERVNLILKSIEENFPLSIDTERQEIIFPEFRDAVITRRTEPVPREMSIQNNSSRFSVQDEQSMKTKDGTMSFSARHIFPAEKEISERNEPLFRESLPQAEVVSVPKKNIPPSNPFIIHPTNSN